MLTSKTLYAPPDVEDAYATWRASCGPTALAAIVRQPVHAIRDALPGFERRGYLNPSQVQTSLNLLRQDWHRTGERYPTYGLAFLQWVGPWLGPGIPAGAAYRYTHWVGVAQTSDYGQMFYDCNTWYEDEPQGAWAPRAWWEKEILPAILNTIPRADGGYYLRWGCEVTHA